MSFRIDQKGGNNEEIENMDVAVVGLMHADVWTGLVVIGLRK